jgi:hypothetical protein
MPEAAVNEYHGAVHREYKIRRTRKVAAVKAKPVSEPVCYAPHHQFWAGVLASNTRHDSASVVSGLVSGQTTGPLRLLGFTGRGTVGCAERRRILSRIPARRPMCA